MLELDPNLYNVAWIAPLEIEAQSALHMLDERHRGRFPMSRGDDHVFHAGRISGHNVVIATLPAGQEYGTGSAAALASQVKTSFPNLWFGLLIGVAAGLPDLSRDPPRDIRLGDVLVALPDGESAGLVAYGLGKATGADEFQPLRLGHVLATTETIVRSAIGSIKLRAPNETALFLPHYEKIKDKWHTTGNFADPGQNKDRLYEVSDCGRHWEVDRPQRPDTKRTRVWYGSIGSGDKLMKNCRQRDQLRDKYNLIGLEMEAAGTMNRIPVGVVRGVCDYGDEHKNKDWQPYAAAMAAAYGKAILSEISPETRAQGSSSYAESETLASRSNRSPNKRSYDEYLGPNADEGPGNNDLARHFRDPSSHSSIGSQTLQRAKAGGRMSLRGSTMDDASSVTLTEEPWSSAWPEYQNERPALASRFLERHDIPSTIKAGGDAWRTSERRTPWTVVLYGLAGIGKSQVCLRAIMENEKRFRGIFYVDASNKTSANSNYLEISRTCGLRNHWERIELDEQIRLTRAWLSCQKDPWLLMIDNADSADVTLAKYIPTGGPGTVLVTTTDERMATCSSAFGKIGPMDEGDAIELLMSYKRPGAVFDEDEREAARLLAVDLLGGLPLAIAQAGSYIFNKYGTYAEYCDEFRRSPQTPLSYELEQWPSYRRPIWTTFSLSLSRIQNLPERGSAQAVELLRTLCFLHHEGIQDGLFREAWRNMKDTPEWSQHVSLLDPSSPRWDTPDLRAAFEILCRYSLLDHASPTAGQYSMHRLVKTICRETLSLEEQRKYVFRAMSMIATALSGIKTPLPWIENPSGFELQKSLLPHIRACVEDRFELIFRDQEQGHDAAEMLLLCAKAYSSTSHYTEARIILEEIYEALGISEAAGAVDTTALQVMEQTAACEACLGWHKKSWAAEKKFSRRATQSFSGLDERLPKTEYLDKLSTYSALADSYQWDGQLLKALTLREDVYTGRLKTLGAGHPDTLLAYDRMLGIKSRLVRTTTAHEEICQRREQVVETWRRMLGDKHPYTLEARVNLGHSYSTVRQWDKALAVQEAVLEIRKRQVREQKLANDDPNYLSSMGNVANILSKMGNSREALAMRKSALKVAEESYGINDRMTFRLGHRVASCYSSRGTADSRKVALQMRRSILEKQKAHLREDDPDILTTMSLLAANLTHPNERAESIQIRKDLLARQQSVLGEKNHDTLENMKELALALAVSTSWCEHREAAQLMEEAEKIEVELLGEDNAQINKTRVGLYRIYRTARENTKARLLARTLKSTGDTDSIAGRDLHMINTRSGSDLETEDEEKAQREREKREKQAAIENPKPRKRKRRRKTRRAPRTEKDSDPPASEFGHPHHPENDGGCSVDAESARPNGDSKLEDENLGGFSGIIAPELRQRHIIDEDVLYPSSSEKYWGESGSEASDGGSGQ